MKSDDIAAAYAAIAQPTRLDLLRLLLGPGETGLSAGEIVARLGVPASTMSFHFKALEQAGLIGSTRHGRSIVYVARPDAVRAMLAHLAEPAGLAFAEEAREAAGRPIDVIFLCTRNSARSVMAEAILTTVGQGRFRVASAGSDPASEGPLPEVVAHLRALGHEVSALRSKSWDDFRGRPMDCAIALCDTLADRPCPDFGPDAIVASWPLPDPAKFTGNAAERATMLGELYAGLKRRLVAFVDLPHHTLPRPALKARIEALANPNLGA
jgi:protein-tyrosine-phosphatase/DNA-binding transcriptional ArsR family regulator